MTDTLTKVNRYTNTTMIPGFKKALEASAPTVKTLKLRGKLISVRTINFVIEHPEIIMGLVYGYAFYQPTFRGFAEKYDITMAEFLAKHTAFEKSYESFQEIQRWKNTLLHGIAGVAVSHGRSVVTDPKVQDLFKAIKHDLKLLFEIVYDKVHEAYNSIFDNDEPLVNQFERDRFDYADVHILDDNYLEEEAVPDLLELWLEEIFDEEAPNVPPLPQHQAKPASLAIFGMNQAQPLPRQPYQSPPGRQSEGHMRPNQPSQSSGSMNLPGSEGAAPAPLEQSSGRMIPPGATGKHPPGTTQALGKQGKATYKPGASSSSGGSRFIVAKPLVSESERKQVLPFNDVLNDGFTFR